jgi:hypothetical protein
MREMSRAPGSIVSLRYLTIINCIVETSKTFARTRPCGASVSFLLTAAASELSEAQCNSQVCQHHLNIITYKHC